MLKKRLIWGIPLVIILLVAVAFAGVIQYVKPTRTLDLTYSEMNWKNKLTEILNTGEPVVSLTEEDVNNLAKKGIVEHAADSKLASGIRGAEFSLDGSRLIADVVGKWSFIRAEAIVEFEMSYQNGTLTLEPESVRIHGHSFSPSLLGVKTITIHPGDYLPMLIQITSLEFKQKEIKAGFSIHF